MSWTKTRSQIAHKIKQDPNADVTDLRRQLKAQRLEEHIKKIVDDFPPLNATERDHLAQLLRPTVGGVHHA